MKLNKWQISRNDSDDIINAVFLYNWENYEVTIDFSPRKENTSYNA